MNELTVRSYLGVKNGNCNYRSPVGSFTANQTNTGGPAPGYLALANGVPVDVSLSQLASPGVCEIINQDASNYCTVGVYDNTTSAFYPMIELLPGENYVVRLSRFLRQELAGTGTHEGHATTLRVEPGRGAGCEIVINAFES